MLLVGGESQSWCWSSSGWSHGPGASEAGACPLVFQAGLGTSVSPLVGGTVFLAAGPRVCDNLCVSFKSGVSIPHNLLPLKNKAL